LEVAVIAPRPRHRPHVRALHLGSKAVVGLVILFLAGSWLAEMVILHPRHWTIGPSPSARGWAYRDVAFKDSAGLTLRGWWIPGINHRTIVMVHGWTSSRAETMSKSAYLHEAGYNLLVFDLRGHGKSEGDYTTMGFREPDDVRAAVTFALSQDPGPIALLGYSMGAAIAIEEAAADQRVSAVVEDSGFSSLVAVVGADFQRVTGLPASPFAQPLLAMGRLDLGFDPAAVQPVVAAARLGQPLLAIVGTADRTVPPAEGFALFGAAAGPKQILVVPGAGHTQAYFTAPQLYRQTVLGFLAKSLIWPRP
jgi:uncharacterized protein